MAGGKKMCRKREIAPCKSKGARVWGSDTNSKPHITDGERKRTSKG